MTEYECDNILCKNGDTLTSLLRGSKEDEISGANSVLGQIADGTNKPGRKWLATVEYNAGDVVSVDNVIFIAKKYTVGKSPKTYKSDWALFQIPYAKAQGLIKAFCVFNGEGTVLQSYNIESLSVNDTYYQFDLTFNTEVNPHSIPICSLPETANDEKLICSVSKFDSDLVRINVKATDIDQTGNVNDPKATFDSAVVITCIIYSTGTDLEIIV